jgi:hypothetical protein
MFEIIKDCSPYYITFTHVGLSDYIKLLQNIANNATFVSSNNKSVSILKEIYPTYHTEEFYASSDDLEKIINKNPCSELLHLDKSAAFLTTYPGVRGPIHQDINGLNKTNVQFRINYPVFVKDDKCITSWYEDIDLLRHSRIPIIDVSMHNPTSILSTNISPNYAVLFNTSIFHDWDNSQSDNKRTIVGMRADNNHSDMTFFDARKILFGI